jgi:hypothetical protein
MRRLTLYLRTLAEPGAPAAGTIAVQPEDRSLSPALLKVASTPVATPLAAAKPQPSSLGLDTSKCVPALLRWVWSCSVGADIELKGVPAGASVDTSALKTELGADTGGTADVSVVVPEGATADKQGVVDAEVKATDITKSRKYSGDLMLDPDEKESPKLSVTVTVRDLILFPILMVLAGVGFAYLLIYLKERARPRQVLRGALSKVAERYAKSKAARSGDYFPYGLGELFPDTWTAKPSCPAAQNASKAVKYWCEIRNADAARMASLETDVQDLDKHVTLWEEAGAAADELRGSKAKLQSAVPGTNRPAVEVRADELLADAPRPQTLAAATDRVTALKTQREAVERWLIGWLLYEKAGEVFEGLGLPGRGLSQTEMDRRNQCNPDSVKDSALWDAADLEQLTDSGAVQQLRACYRELLSIDAAHPPGLVSAQAAGEPEPVPPTPTGPTPIPVSQQIADDVKQRDWIISLLAVIPVIGVYLFGFYGDGAFGAWWEYAAAFFAGAAGEVAINFHLLPGWRSPTDVA